MDEKILKKMENLYKVGKSIEVGFLGSIYLTEKDFRLGINKLIKKDIIVSIEKRIDGKFMLKFYDTNNELIAINFNDGQGIRPVSKYVYLLNMPENELVLDTLNQFNIDETNSLSGIESQLKQISEKTGVAIENIKDISCIQKNEKVKQLEKEEKLLDDKIKVKDKILNAIEKQGTDLSQKVDDIHTLGEILGVPDEGTLVAVYSDDIENNKIKNSTRFSFLIRDKDGNYRECNNLEQLGGVTPNAKVAASNFDGSEVQAEQVNSFYRIKSSTNIEYTLTAKIGQYGEISLGIGQLDKTKGVNGNDLVTVTTPLKTTSIYHTTAETRKDLNGTRDGIEQSKKRVLEGEMHSKTNCETDKDEFDGDFDTGHKHNELNDEKLDLVNYTEQQFYEMALNILKNSDTIAEVYNRNDIVNKLKIINQEQPELTDEELLNAVQSVMEESALQEHTRFR